jgi:hypothetical protein
MKSALKRFPIRQYGLPTNHPAQQHSSPAHSLTPKHSTPTSTAIPPQLHYPSSSSTSSSGNMPLPLPYHHAEPLPELDQSMTIPLYYDTQEPEPLPDNDQSMLQHPNNSYLMISHSNPNSHNASSHDEYMAPHMTLGSPSSSNASMPTPPETMDDNPILPFSNPTGPQFADLNSDTYIQRPITPQFMTYRDSRSTNAPDIQAAPRYVDAYGNPFVQWPPARADQPHPTQTQGTFDGLRISDRHPQLAPQAAAVPSAPVLVHQQPSWTSTVPTDPRLMAPYGQPVFSRRQQRQATTIVRPAIQNQQLALPQAGHVVQPTTYALVPVRDPNNPPSPGEAYQRPPELSRTLSIDAIAISAAPANRQTACPQPLTITEKVMAFLGNDHLLSRHSLRQTIKRGPSSSSC